MTRDARDTPIACAETEALRPNERASREVRRDVGDPTITVTALARPPPA